MPTPIDRPTLRLALDAARKILAEGPHPGRAWRDTETLLVHALRQHGPETNLAWLIAHESDPLAPDAAAAFCELIERRLASEPIQYITGETEFYGLPFHVNCDVLIPRPETEHLVEKAIELAQEMKRTGAIRETRIVDVGTGSGAIAVALARALQFAQITATDISAAALDVARSNAERNGVAGRIRFLEGDLLDPVGQDPFEFVISNPPYVPHIDRNTLDVEVRNFEPPQALFAGDDGLAIYRRLIPAAWDALVAGGFVMLEIGFGQELAIGALLGASRFTQIEFALDLQGIPRVAVAQRG
ncbi:MAG: peptide chain release factor N(5)-glutamine methyltransferase [Terracidiphilus sp.]|jgi:release factor glutamine methyltransferase